MNGRKIQVRFGRIRVVDRNGKSAPLRTALEGALDTADDEDTRYYIRTALQLYDAERR